MGPTSDSNKQAMISTIDWKNSIGLVLASYHWLARRLVVLSQIRTALTHRTVLFYIIEVLSRN